MDEEISSCRAAENEEEKESVNKNEKMGIPLLRMSFLLLCSSVGRRIEPSIGICEARKAILPIPGFTPLDAIQAWRGNP